MFSSLLAFLGLLSPWSLLDPQTPLGPSVPYINPALNGGSMLDSSAGLGEPLNIIVSAFSSPKVLNTGGLENWARSFDFSTECFGINLGGPQSANLGDGRGWVNQTAVLRYDYMNVGVGTCLESLSGGNHFRFWQQVNTGAYFLACSVEEWLGQGHNIVPNGYDLGRDAIVASAEGQTSYKGVTYLSTVEYVTGLLTPGSTGINHGIAIDGKVAIITVKIK
ncbi:hypothetical protein BS47DRAFT_1338730 [Hydnum rufescens UP504]|uniref:Uncharacterized protein n=1 Tax=Hydnum rufescens UP504 TaxID=1448309 RepID=A0A9P6DY64_9AGAM|nr:hypothetical protein BS47DRAFT_1338730 [Hydnum rufescens UP504]